MRARRRKSRHFSVRVADATAPLEVCIFNIGANVNFPLLETTERVFRKVWEMACYAWFLTAREAARLMLPRGRGNIFFTGATAGMRGGVGYTAFASAKSASCGGASAARSSAREHPRRPSGHRRRRRQAWLRERIKEREGEAALANLNPGRLMRPKLVAEAYWQISRSRATPGRSSARSDPLQKNGEAMPKVEFHFDFGSPNAYLRIW